MSSEIGASIVEYALMIALIAVIAFPAVAILGHETSDGFDTVAVATGEALGGTDDQTSTTLADTKEPDPGRNTGGGGTGGGGSGGSGTTTTTSTTSTTSTTMPAPVPEPGSTVVTGKSSSEYFKFNATKNGGEGVWKATVGHSNEWIRDQYLTLEITRIDESGKRTTSTIEGFMVPSGGIADFVSLDNAISIIGEKKSGVLSVEVKVVSILTSGKKGQKLTYKVDEPPTVVAVPKTP